VKYEKSFPHFEQVKESGIIDPPDIAPGESGQLSIPLPDDWKGFDVLYLTVPINMDGISIHGRGI